MGSHGLDLSFVTHVFLMEEIWDKSLEQQVVGGNALLNVAGKKKRKRNRGDAKKVPTGNKNSFLQRKLDYVLNHFRLLDSNVAAEPRQVRFVVVDEKDGTTIRQAIHTIQSPETPATSSSSAPRQSRGRTLQPASTDRNTTTTAEAMRVARPTGNTAANSRPHVPAATRVASTRQHKHSRQQRQPVQLRPLAKSTARAVDERELGSSTQANTTDARKAANVGTGNATPLVRSKPTGIVDPPTRANQQSTRTTSVSSTRSSSAQGRTTRPPDPEDIIVIEDEPVTSQPQPLPPHISAAKETKSDPEIIVIDDSEDSESGSSRGGESDDDISMASSSSSCSADNEEHFGSDDREDDSDESDESDEESKALLSRLFNVANRQFARRRTFTQSSHERPYNTISTPTPVEPVRAIDDEETETE
ncbi:hypothetical protein PI124_g5573 [Phytophthora idaei]|nr:hypothetical protein PI124_g5573 [Phytophthora idaei]